MSQNPPSLMTSLTKDPKPKNNKFFFHCRLEDLLCCQVLLWGFEHLSSTIGWWITQLVWPLKTTWF